MSDLQFIALAIDNFKSFSGHHEFKLDRPPGLIYVTGKNLLAPELGANGVGKSTLFDAMLWCLWSKTGRDNRPANAIQPWGKKGSTQVRLVVQKNGIPLTFWRSRAPNSLRVSTGNRADGPLGREIQQEEVPGLIGMSEEMFRRTLILGQFGQLFLDLKPEAQSQMFTEALSLDIWLKASGIAGEAEKKLIRERGQIDLALAGAKAVLETLSGQIEDAEDKAASFESSRAARIATLETDTEDLEQARADLKEVEEPALPKDAALDGLRADAQALKTKLALLYRDVRDATDDVADAETAYQKLQRQEANAEKKCPACGQGISDKEFKEKLAAAKAAWEKVSAISAGLGGDWRAAKSNAEAAEKAVSEKSTQFEEAQKGYRKNLEAFTGWRDAVRSNGIAVSQKKADLAKEQKAANEYQSLAASLKSRRQTKRGEKRDAEDRLQAIGEKIGEAQFWIDAYREIRLGIIDDALIELKMASARHMAMLGLNDWGIKFDTERETKSGSVSYGFTVLLYPPGEPEPVKWESYSGGEAQRVQLAVSFALSEVLLARAGLSPSLEIYDEPTRGLSAGGVDDLLEHLHDRALELGRTIYFCDHHSLDKGAFSGVLQITKDKKGSSAAWL